MVGAIAAVLVQTLRLWLLAGRPTRLARARSRRGVRGEAAAESLLERLGYEVEARQATAEWSVVVGGETRSFSLRADFVVRKDGRRLIADAKTGERAPLVSSAATRRQLLEYRLAFDVDGVLLVDVETGDVKELEFVLPTRMKPPPWDLRLLWLLAGVALGLGLARF
jgi:hypothetical protein